MQIEDMPYITACDIPDDLLHVDGNPDKLYSIACIDFGLNNRRTYTAVFDRCIDTHNEIERVGIQNRSRIYTYVFSLEESLDYILHIICGADIHNVRQMDGYLNMSRTMLKLDMVSMDTLFPLGKFVGLDSNLDKFLVSIGIRTNPRNAVLELMKSVYTVSNDLVACASVELVGMLKISAPAQFVKKSYNISSLVCGSNTKIDVEDLDIVYENSCKYPVRLRCYEKLEYLSETFKNELFLR
jgi:hypothetical protein